MPAARSDACSRIGLAQKSVPLEVTHVGDRLSIGWLRENRPSLWKTL
jgi:hypothetical protein